MNTIELNTNTPAVNTRYSKNMANRPRYYIGHKPAGKTTLLFLFPETAERTAFRKGYTALTGPFSTRKQALVIWNKYLAGHNAF